ncbi:hypothetical protein V8E54_008646 [Elaphomyces granulatus]
MLMTGPDVRRINHHPRRSLATDARNSKCLKPRFHDEGPRKRDKTWGLHPTELHMQTPKSHAERHSWLRAYDAQKISDAGGRTSVLDDHDGASQLLLSTKRSIKEFRSLHDLSPLAKVFELFASGLGLPYGCKHISTITSGRRTVIEDDEDKLFMNMVRWFERSKISCENYEILRQTMGELLGVKLPSLLSTNFPAARTSFLMLKNISMATQIPSFRGQTARQKGLR